MTRKLALDVCEMVIKWELLRLQKVEQLTQGLTSHDDEVWHGFSAKCSCEHYTENIETINFVRSSHFIQSSFFVVSVEDNQWQFSGNRITLVQRSTSCHMGRSVDVLSL